jgi:hypothetical protein
MDLVLGLSMSSKDIRGMLVDGVTGEGAQVDRSVLDISDDDAFDAEAFLESLLVGGEPRTVGLTWSQDAEPAAIKVREALGVLGGGAPLVAVPDVEAAEALARGIADITGHDFLVVCIVEPDTAVIATVDWHRVAVECIDRADSATLIDRARAVVRSARPSPDAIFVLGSADTDELVSALTAATPRPVVTATEADFALTRGAALASARATNVPDAPVARPRISRVGVLSSMLAAAIVAFVVSIALVVGLRLTADSPGQPSHSNAAGHPAQPPAPPRTVRDAPALRLAREPFATVAPPVPEAVPPAAPAYVPPAPPAHAPAAPPPQPRLRDRILEKIPLVNRLR